MRVVVSEFISLDGIVQAAGLPLPTPRLATVGLPADPVADGAVIAEG